MYNNLTNSRRGRPWQTLLLLALFAWLLPQTAAASYEDEADNYTVSLGGSNIVFIQAPLYDQSGADTWVYDGNLKVEYEGHSVATILHWSAKKDIDDDATTLPTYFSTTADGFFDITLGNSRSTSRLTKDNAGNRSIVRNSDGRTFEFSAEWVVPYDMLGKKLTFTWYVKRSGNSATVLDREVPGLKTVTINMPEASAKLTPFVSLPMLSPDDPGKLELPWFLASDSIVSARYEYVDAAGKRHEEKIDKVKSGSIQLDANVPHRNFRLICSYKQPGDKGSYLIDNQSSTVQNIPLLHSPIGFTARPLNDQKVKVEVAWSVPYMDDDDLTPTDFFEIQRSLTGEEADFVTVHQEPYISVNKKATYTFIDSTLIDDISERMLQNGGTLDKLTYRIRRTMTADWNWAKNSCASTARCVLDNLHLLRIQDYSARWEDEKAYTVRVNWDYVKEPGAVWDERAKMVLRVMSRNAAGAVVDSLIYELDDKARAQRSMVVNLSRSCVYYDIDMYVERGESPLKLSDEVEPYFFPIRSYEDWQEFNRRGEAAGGQYDLNARLYADITVNTILGWKEGSPYRGTFDGNGHTLTINYDGSANSAYNNAYIAPFRYVTNATIMNLHVAGTISTSGRTAAGLIASVRANSTVSIENCRVSATINSSVDGDATNGGFVSIVNAGADVTFRNCKFDGSFEGDNCYANGGFVGYTNAPVIIDNCVFAPDRITTKLQNCATWARIGSGSCMVINSYATREYSAYIVIRNASDWTKFRDMVKAANGQYDVDAVLDADVNAGSIMVGWESGYYYRGTFDGNGHTLTFDVPDHGAEFLAPFRYVGNATIKNLHTAGTFTTTKRYASGLIGWTMENATVNIENCHSSVTLKSSVNNNEGLLAGFIARLSASNVTISNCKFDGSFDGANCTNNRGYVAWVARGSNLTITNCLFAPDQLNTKLDGCENWVGLDTENVAYSITNSYATKYYGTEIVTIDGKPFMVLRNSTDWGNFLGALSKNPATNAIMDADFKITTPADDFRGIFDGNGHTLDIEFSNVTANMAIFKYAIDYEIKNLRVTGKIWGGIHSATFVGESSRSGAVASKILNCRSSVLVQCSSTSGFILGGFVGRGRGVDIVSCLFDGELWCNASDPWAGAFYGFVDGNLDGCVQRCLEHASSYTYINHKGLNIKSSMNFWGNGENQWSYGNYSYNGLSGATSTAGLTVEQLVEKLGSDNWENVSGWVIPKMFTTTIPENTWSTMSASEMVEALGSDGWEVVDGKAVPLMRATTIETSEESFASKLGNGWTKENGALVPTTSTIEIVTPSIVTHTAEDFKEFYHKNTGTIDKTLVTTTRQSSVLLAWNTDGNPIDYFRVMRRMQGQGDDAWTEVATDLSGLSYEDTSVSPLVTYEYKVQGVNDCEGRDSTETQVKVGECKHTGRVEGYVRFNDGTSAAGIQVEVVHGTDKVVVTTDDSGHFVADELSYYGQPEVTYEVSAVSREGVEFSPTRASVTFDAHSNDETLREISILNGKRFSGFVMYDGTSIPVKGANFTVNGHKVYNTKGKLLETDYDGSFSFRVLPGNDTIQVVMDGHTFTNGGYYKGAKGHTFTDDVANTYFYDATKVKLVGRVVGGNDQGQKPLMNNLSKNNLGDSLRIVLTLEGDNTSWLVYDNLNPNRSKREEVVRHQRRGDLHYTQVTTERKRMTIWPDATTGEYEVLLPPVRWKVQQVYCTGYPTLFQEGQVSEVVDLTDCLVPKDTTVVGSFKDVDKTTVVDPKAEYHAVYNRIYHAPVEVTYKQLTYDTFNYFGDKNYYATELTGDQVEVPLAYLDPVDSVTVHYTFTYPVFSVERKYTIELQVGENYPYNNDPTRDIDIVRLGGGYAAMQNGLNPSAAADKPVEVDSLGRARFTLTAGQTPVLLTKESALKTVTFTVLRDGTYIEAKPLQAFVLNMFPVGDSKDVLTDGQPILFDILRDPPGSYSTNTLAKGATLNYTYMMNLTLVAGPVITYKSGKQLQTLSATVVAPAGSGTAVGPISAGVTEEGTVDQFMYNAQGSKAFSYTMVVGNNISTSGDPSMVGADADLYIGAVQNVQVTPMSSIRAVDKKMFDQIAGRQGGVNKVSEVAKYNDYGTMVKIAEGKNAKGDTLYLIRDVALGYGPKIQSQFVYSQKQLLTQIIPNKVKEVVDMLFCGTKAQAQAVADSTGKAVYWSLREPTDTLFAVVNKLLTDRSYNDSIDKAEPGINYMVVRPKGTSREDFKDEVREKYQIAKAWLDMIAQNESEKLQTHDLLANYDVAGAQGVNYSETFDSNFSNSFMHHFPIATEVDYFEQGKGASNAFSALSIGATIVGGFLATMAEMKKWTQPTVASSMRDVTKDQGWYAQVEFAGSLSQWTITPVVLYSTVGSSSEAKAYSRTESFTIAPDPMSRLNVDVYRVKPQPASAEEVNASNIFTNYQYDKMYNEVSTHVMDALKNDGILGPRGFVFRTRGGATQNPWEDKRVTQFYSPGRTLDERTLKIVNPRIRMDKQSVSGVSIDDAAKFTVFVSNESEKPEATEGLTVLQLFAADQANPRGAKISVNGQPLTTGGMTISVVPGLETALQMEVRAGQGFDFDGLTIGVLSPTDPVNTKQLLSFNVHFLREAGGVNIAVPGDKWVLNTNAQVDGKRGWYLPVTINGFDRHQHNFDHIEFQYKESQRGDDSWTNICSFYADSTLMANANGVCELMKPNGNITTEFYGEGWVTERNYDLRAVVFCRNGSDFLTTASKVISGIKDTRRPQLFGTPEPKSGILTAGDDIIFNFSEDIENNYLSAITNFEVKGEVNNSNLSEMVSVQFNGKGSVESEAKRNFTGKDLTIDLMVKPDETGRDMPLFSHGTNNNKLQLWLTSDFKLKAVVNQQEFTSETSIVKRGFTQVALVLNQTDSLVTFYNGGVEIGRGKLNALYRSTGPLIFGRTNELDRARSTYYQGRMMEARLWYSAMSGGQIGTTYGSHRLTGYEKDLVDYYPMNEGSGDYVTDHTQGANARLMGAGWAIPRGVSLRLEKADKGVQLTRDAMNSTAEQDYTMMFWFKTDAEGRGTLLSNGRGLKADNGAENQFHIGFEGDTLRYRSNGFVTDIPGNWSDGDWHNYAMTVNRGRGVANIYVDKELRATFETDSLGGISGGYPLIGASRYDIVNKTDTLLAQDGKTPLKGYVDELMFFGQALPEQLISTYATKSPAGDEAGLMTYLGFDRIERQKDNDLEVVSYAYSKKVYLDDKGEPRYQLNPETKEPTDTLVRDYVFVDSLDEIVKHFDADEAAPVVPNEEVKNLKFGFIGKGNQLLVEIDEPAARLNHRNIYVTVRDIEDKNGNTMASPKTACYYVTNSSLQWMVNRLDTTIKYGSGEGCELPFFNNGAQAHSYTIENCPRWLTLNKYSDAIAPQSMDYVMATVSKDLNVGTYNEIIYLTDEEGITEPFYLNLTVEGEQPEWAQSIDSNLLANSMSISGQVYLYDELDTDTRDIVGVFDNENRCHGFANITHDVQSSETGLFLTVYDSQPNGRELSFRLWQYSTGREIVLTTKPAITFTKDAMLGADTPVRFDGGEDFVQYFHLKEGWNWVSFNVSSSNPSSMKSLLTSMPWQKDDIVTVLGGKLTATYDGKQWMALGQPQDVPVSAKTAYAIYVHQECAIPLQGTVIKDKADRTISLKQGWNGIGYTPAVNLSVETALSDYYDYAQQGDVIKSHTEFAYFTKTGNTGRWRGSLQYMKPGEGYMLLRKGATRASFTYPYYDMSSDYRVDRMPAINRIAQQSRSTMSVSAVVEGFEVEEGDKLVAYANGEVVGETPLSSPEGDTEVPVFYLSIGSTEAPSGAVGGATLWFAIERDGEIVASTDEVMAYEANAVIGSPDEPTVINFVRADYEDGQWFSISGMKLPKKPTLKGVYIFNGKKVMVK